MLGRIGEPSHLEVRRDCAIQLKKNGYCVTICQRANQGECQQTVCHKFSAEHSKAQNRSRGDVLSDKS